VLTAVLFPIGSDNPVATVVSEEAANRKGTHAALFVDVPAGQYQLIAFPPSSSIPAANWYVTLPALDGTYLAREYVVAGFDQSTQSQFAGLLETVATLAARFTGISSLANWLRRIVRKDSGTAGMATAQTEINTGGSATFLGTTDSLENIKDTLLVEGSGGLTEADLDAIVTKIKAAPGVLPAPFVRGRLRITKGDAFSHRFEITVLTFDRLVWTLKRGLHDSDDEALLTVDSVLGITRLDGNPVTPDIAPGGTLVYDTDEIVLTLIPEITELIPEGEFFDGIKRFPQNEHVRNYGPVSVIYGAVQEVV
jgi:hypothetical protein